MKIEKLKEKEMKLREQIKAGEKKLAALKAEHKEIARKIKDIEEMEVITYVRSLKLTPQEAKDVIRRFAESGKKD